MTCSKLLVTFILFISTTVAFAQTTVRGTIRNAENQTPVSAANIYLVSEADSTISFLAITDSLGRFQFVMDDKPRITLNMTSVGYESDTITVELDSSSVELDALYLKPSSTFLDEVVIKSNITLITTSTGNTVVRVANNKELTTTQNFMETLKRIPGLIVDGENTILMGNGVTPEVFIDGKPLHLNGPELISYLQGLSPERVLSVELITNPSARYDGEFKAIIDIKLSMERNTGWATSYTGQVDQNEYTSAYQNLNLSFNRDKLQAFATFNYAGGKTSYRYAAFQHLPNTNFMTTQLNQVNGQNNYNLQAGLEYTANEKNKLGALVRYYHPINERDRAGSILTVDGGEDDTVFHYLNTNPLHDEQRNLGITLNYELKLEDIQLDFLANRLSVHNTQRDDFLNSDALSGTRLDYWESDLRNRFLINSFQVDVSRKVKDWTVESGVKIVNSASDNHLRFDVWDEASESLSYDAARSNVFEYTERIKAAYLAFSGNLGKVTLNGGLRAEHTYSVSNSITLDSVVNNRYLTWLPSLSASYQIDHNRDISVSFSSRLTRPNFTQLNPFRFYFSVFNYWIGNPYLLPARRDQFKLNYHVKHVHIETNFGIERDVLARYPLYDSVTNEMAFLGRNLPQKKFASIVFSFPVEITPWWEASYQFAGYYNKEETPYLGEVFNLDVYNYITRLNQTFSLPRNTVLNLLVNYESKTGNSLYVIKPMHNVDLNVQKTWLQGKLSAKLALLDVFNTYRQYLIFRRKDILNNELSHWWGIRKVQFSLTYTIGNTTFNTRKQTVSDEEDRVR